MARAPSSVEAQRNFADPSLVRAGRFARAACLALTLLTAAWSSNAWCQDVAPGQREAGEALLQAGKVAYDAGDYPAALRHFEQALARLGRPTIHYDIAQAAARAGDHMRALTAFREYLSALPNAPNRPEVERRIQAHERALSYAAPAPSQPADLSPTAAANTQAPATPSSDSSSAPRVSDQGQSSELWWLWAGIGAAVVGTVVAALIVTSSDDPVQPPMRGDVGGTIQTLEVR